MSSEAPTPEESPAPQRVWVTTLQIVGLVGAMGGVFWAVIWALSEPGRLQSLVWPAISIVFGISLLVRILRKRQKRAV